MEMGERDWASLPPELLAVLFRKVQNRAGAPGEGRRLLAVAAVCRAWRRCAQHEFLQRQPLDLITFPAAIRRAAPSGSSNLEYLLKKTGDTYRLVQRRVCGDEYFLLGARKKYTIGSSHFRISTDPKLLWSTQGSSGSDGHDASGAVLKSNIWRTAFNLHYSGSTSETFVLSVKFDEVAVNGNCQRKMRCELGPRNHVKRDLAWWPSWLTSILKWNHDLLKLKNPVPNPASNKLLKHASLGSGLSDSVQELRSKDPEWHEQEQCWSLEFKGRASKSAIVASIHNFQLVSHGGGSDSSSGDARVVLQLGKVCKGLFVLDFGAPLSPLEAFAISLSSFSTSVGLDA